MIFGSLVHAMVLEPESVAGIYCKEEHEGDHLNKNSKAYKEARKQFLQENEGKTIISKGDWQRAEMMAEQVNLIAGGLLHNGVAEHSCFAVDEAGIGRKCRPDYYIEHAGIVIDLKTTRSYKPYEFQKTIHEYRYHRQAAWYLDALRLAGKPAETFIIIAVDKNSPYTPVVYQMDDESIEVGRRAYGRLLDSWKRYKETGTAEVVKSISLPKWALEAEQQGGNCEY